PAGSCGIVTVSRALAGRQEDLPLLALRILDPALFALRVTTVRCALFKHRAIDAPQPGVQVLKFLAAFGLYSQLLNPSAHRPLTDREVDTWILEHPLRVVRLAHRGFGREQLRIETDGRIEVLDGDVD